MTRDVHTLDEVYGVARDLPENYVTRDSVDAAFVEALTRDQHIVVYGSSKQGKTCLRKYNLDEREYVVVTCNNKWSLGQLHSAILKAVGYVVEGTSTKTVSGDLKVNAKLKTGLNFWAAKGEAEAGTEATKAEGAETTSTPMELDASDVNDVVDALDAANAPQFIVLEDFHYLPEETQRDFAVALKAFHEDSKYSFIVVGVWLDENRLVQHNGDLTGRVITIDADRWTSDDLLQVIEGGEELLNIEFDAAFKETLLDGCFESIWVVQESCRKACEDAGIRATQDERTHVSGDAGDLIKTAVDAHSARYNGFITNYCLGFQTTALEMHRWLLYAVLNASALELERGLLYGDLRVTIDTVHPKAPINAGNLTQALLSTASLQVGKMAIKPIILDYDQSNRRLNVVDRSFLIWLEHREKSELLTLADLPVD
ncbi:hypothetical protein GCM10009623_06500 [Nocardioides aestuarii]|uniref:ATP-binding protein n=1 Tax=Nocardioides aestuarii TaxID=252231 RepID=A0ABW4TFW8_9ACTN